MFEGFTAATRGGCLFGSSYYGWEICEGSTIGIHTFHEVIRGFTAAIWGVRRTVFSGLRANSHRVTAATRGAWMIVLLIATIM